MHSWLDYRRQEGHLSLLLRESHLQDLAPSKSVGNAVRPLGPRSRRCALHPRLESDHLYLPQLLGVENRPITFLAFNPKPPGVLDRRPAETLSPLPPLQPLVCGPFLLIVNK